MSKAKYLSGATSLLKWAVLYPIDEKNSFIKKFLYFVWSVYFISTFIVTEIQCVIKLAIEPFDLIAENVLIMNAAIYLNLFTNFIIFFYHADNMVTLVTNINENFIEKTDNGIEDISMEHYRILTNKVPMYFTVTLVCSALYNGILSLFSGDRALPIPGWFPYDYTQSPFYEISCVWQILCQINLGTIYGCTDILYPTMSMVIGYQFKILISNFKNTFYFSLWKCGIPKETVKEFKMKVESEDMFSLAERYQNIFQLTKSTKFRRINMNYFKRNIQHHRLLLGYCDDLNRIMGWLLFTKIVAAFFNVTMVAFTVITSGDLSKTVTLGSYIVFGLVEVFLYTYGGQILTDNTDFLWSLYETPWYLCDLQYQKMFLFVQMNANKMIFTKAANFFPMTAPMFITVMRSIFSYVTLLQRLGGAE